MYVYFTVWQWDCCVRVKQCVKHCKNYSVMTYRWLRTACFIDLLSSIENVLSWSLTGGYCKPTSGSTTVTLLGWLSRGLQNKRPGSNYINTSHTRQRTAAPMPILSSSKNGHRMTCSTHATSWICHTWCMMQVTHACLCACWRLRCLPAFVFWCTVCEHSYSRWLWYNTV